jgi:nucleotide-binding universal stress UspA family protein
MNTSNEQRSYPIVVGVDYSELGDLALERACDLAKAQERTHLHVVHVGRMEVPNLDKLEDEASTSDLSEADRRLRDHVQQIVKRWCDAHLASDVEADLVVVGTHGRRGARRFLLGSTTEATVRLAPCAVLVVRPREASIPQIDPPCPRCLQTRRATDGKRLWCKQHSEHHEKRHTYHYSGAPDSHQSGLLIHLE